MTRPLWFALTALALVAGCAGGAADSEPATEMPAAAEMPPAAALMTVAETPTRAQAADGRYISWKEHIIDDEAIGGVAISGSDGLAIDDLDKDGHIDIVSVHESDTTYDGVADGHIRIAFGSADPDGWELATLAVGEEAGAAEDVAIADMNGDGFPDVVAACELAHLIYFENPGSDIRTTTWRRVIPPMTKNRGSYIRVFTADFDMDGRPEVVAPNKGGQNPGREVTEKSAISYFALPPDPLDGSKWVEHELTRVVVPINSQPVDLDGDGDLDILGGSRHERRIFWLENLGGEGISFKEHPIEIGGSEPPAVTGFNLDFFDFSSDGRLDVAVGGGASRSALTWFEQPEDPAAPWMHYRIGDFEPDVLVGFAITDINGDGNPDVMAGAYSQGPRDKDGDVTADDAVGRLAWFEHPGDPKGTWIRHDFSRRARGMFDKFVPRDMDGDGDVDFMSTRGNSVPYDGVFWLEQVRTAEPVPAFDQARATESVQLSLPGSKVTRR